MRVHGVRSYAPLLAEAGAHLAWEAEMRRPVTVEMTDRVAVDCKAEFSARARACLNARPRGDLVGDSLAAGALIGHGYLLEIAS
jgi:hypothetical protein